MNRVDRWLDAALGMKIVLIASRDSLVAESKYMFSEVSKRRVSKFAATLPASREIGGETTEREKRSKSGGEPYQLDYHRNTIR